MTSTSVALSSEYGVLAARGPDARKFLHGQVSQDVLGLAAGRAALAGLHNPQGRTLAVLRLVADGDTDVLMVLPRDLLASVQQTLGKFVLRAKLKLSDESDAWDILGLLTDASGDGFLWSHAADARRMQLRPRAVSDLDEGELRAALAHWHAADIAAGVPTVRAATSGAFVAQMLNLDVLGGIAFDKGCYTGQEVIARAHYRGRVKRRLQRFVTPAAANLRPGDTCSLEDGRTCEVVDAVVRADGRCEFLAVTTFEVAAKEALPLPYSLAE